MGIIVMPVIGKELKLAKGQAVYIGDRVFQVGCVQGGMIREC
jgi:hypothetical protein